METHDKEKKCEYCLGKGYITQSYDGNNEELLNVPCKWCKAEPSPTHEQIQWIKDFDNEIPGIAIHPISEKHHHDTIKAFFLSILQHFHDEVMATENKTGCGMTCNTCDFDEGWEEWCGCPCHKNESDGVIKISDLQAIFTRYGVGDKL